MVQEMRLISDRTCIRFVPRTTQVDWVDIFSGTGCGSAVGRNGGRQTISMRRPACFQPGIPVHELMHTLGFLHMHQHTNRDNFVRVLWQNVNPGSEHNFNIPANSAAWSNFNTPYDFRSVVHYGSRTIQTIDPRNQALIGTAVPSDGDILRINRMYNCRV
jgi:Astacin (Peptidase family M12A)